MDEALPILALPVHLRIEIAVIKNDRVGPRQTVRESEPYEIAFLSVI
jgi:hypothetical protein